MPALTTTSGRPSVRKKLMTTLFVSQICGSTGQSIALAIGSIMAASITGTNTWSGMPVAISGLGSALASWPLSRLMNRSGRRPGLALGYGIAVIGAGLGMVGVTIRSFPLMLGGMVLFGIGTSSNLLARYAAADVSGGAERGRAMGLIVGGSTIGSIMGPMLMSPTLRVGALLGVPETASAFLVSIAGFAVAALVIEVFLRPDPLVVARQYQERMDAGRPVGVARRAGEIFADVRVQIALATLSISQFVMISTTSTSPVYLHDQGHNVQTIGVAVSLHLAGMYVTSPLSGWLCDRFGRLPMIGVGAALLIVAVVPPDGCAVTRGAGAHAGARRYRHGTDGRLRIRGGRHDPRPVGLYHPQHAGRGPGARPPRRHPAAPARARLDLHGGPLTRSRGRSRRAPSRF